MKIGYYLGSAALSGGGIGPYAWRVLDLLLGNCKSTDIRILVLCTKESQKECFVLVNKRQAQANVTVRLVPDRFSLANRFIRIIRAGLARILNKLHIQNRLDLFLSPSYRWFRSLNIDLLHVPYQTPPLFDLPYPFIVTMHDVQELHYPEYFTPEQRAWRAEFFWKSLQNASGVIVSFGHVKQDLVKFFNLPEAKVFVCPLPYDQIRLDSQQGDHDISRYVKKYEGLNDFILYPAQTWQHKNHLSLIKALELIRERHQRTIHLVCTGKKNSFFDEVIESYLNGSSVSDQIHFVGIVPEGELRWLYKTCALVVIPTLYEAGSFPLLEAMGLGAPVICSSVTSLPETISDSRFIFDPLDIVGMSLLILRMLGNLELRQANIKNSKARIDQLRKVDSFKSIYTAWRNTL